jgi:AmmeMemoRadiSam system protein A
LYIIGVAMAFQLSREEKHFLLKLAKETIKANLEKKPLPAPPYFTENLKTKSGAFVTLKANGNLRGCIGWVLDFKPLQDAVQELSLSAAFHDPRFQPLNCEEYNSIELEISVLTPPEMVLDIEKINVGSDGLIIKNGLNEGLLLPQVATEYGWDRTTFLEQTCHKAGLPLRAYLNPKTEIKKFTAIVFSENSFSQ